MKVFILDSNLVFSAALNIKNPIGRFIMSANERDISFYAPEYLTFEIEKYFSKLVEVSQLEEKQVRRIINLIYTQINFISDNAIPVSFYIKALPFVKEVDIDDLPFVALNEYLDELFWTGDKQLYNGLISKGYTRVVTFDYIKKHILDED